MIQSKHGSSVPPGMGPTAPYITTQESALGAHFAVMFWFNPDLGGFFEPWDSAIGRHPTADLAVSDAKQWAQETGLEYRP